jgi:hypothetical protein
MRVLICGGRDYTNVKRFWYEIDKISQNLDFDNNQPITIIHGAAKGADSLANDYAEECGWDVEVYPADWGKYGNSAGPIRNQQMLDSKPDLVIAFPGRSGTAHMVSIAKKAKIKVIEVK